MELFTPGHLLVLAIVVAVLFFGWKQLPEMSRSLGRSLRIFKTEIKGMSEDDKARKNAQPQALEGSQPVQTAQPAQSMQPPTVIPPAGPITESAEPAVRPRPRPSPVTSPPGQAGDNPSVN